MKRSYSHISFYRSLPLWVGLLSLLFVGCKDDEPVTPFVRLLENQKMYSALFDNDITYAVLLPDGYDQSTDSYPVVYLLHGYGDTERAWYTSGGLQYYVDQYAGEIVPMIFVMPAAYKSYYVNRFSGDYPYMDMMTDELVPAIDSLFRTKKDKFSRAVMGYSMGGYGAMVLPGLRPDVFTVGVPLSMSFRTDAQYMAEPQDVFNSQWGILFGGHGSTGQDRLTNYFIQHSPFHFFGSGDPSRFDDVKFLIDCGDDEESLSITNDNLHAVMRDNLIGHEYRVRNGEHSFTYWKKSYPEAFPFISHAFTGTPHPAEPVPVSINPLISSTVIEELEIAGLTMSILTPVDYATSSANFPVLYWLHDYEEGQQDENRIKTFSLLRNSMIAGSIPKSILVEIPIENSQVTSGQWADIVTATDTAYRTIAESSGRILIGNNNGGLNACTLSSDLTTDVGSCFLFNASLPDVPPVAASAKFYYMDSTDDFAHYRGYQQMYAQIRNEEIAYEYRVRQGVPSFQAFLNGLNESLTSLRETLNN